MKKFIVPLLTLLSASGLVFAAPEMQHNASAPHVAEYHEAMASMHDDMMQGIGMSNPDAAFAAGMLPHHQGAVKMAEIELKYGKDPQMRQLAENIIAAQQAEIDLMQNWLRQYAKHQHD
ncbi:CopM family metallochaperone [Paralysiella testudinis]|uniref:DUF305 domain-containing protein n=1 Tax=Paralysiella testudinis TaxID=2809020 RepID=A0A892ZF45_9NEIS|nr:DUF305 domain-containing protein [Paralysiella testudinis]QRQ82045.1 DUF305 domain-containing protein [Paralysiella testudinis]